MNGLFEEANMNTKNHKFWIEKGELKSAPASADLIKELRDSCDHNQWMAIGRSCFECNACHYHLIDMDYLNCFSCGKFFRKGVDITEYEEEKLI